MQQICSNESNILCWKFVRFSFIFHRWSNCCGSYSRRNGTPLIADRVPPAVGQINILSLVGANDVQESRAGNWLEWRHQRWRVKCNYTFRLCKKSVLWWTSVGRHSRSYSSNAKKMDSWPVGLEAAVARERRQKLTRLGRWISHDTLLDTWWVPCSTLPSVPRDLHPIYSAGRWNRISFPFTYCTNFHLYMYKEPSVATTPLTLNSHINHRAVAAVFWLVRQISHLPWAKYGF